MHFFTHTQPKNSQSGQIAVIVLLIMAVLLVIGISLANRTSQEITLSSQQQETTRVFNAAEMGIEQALQENLGIGTTSITVPKVDNITVTTSVVDAQSTDQNIIQPGETRSYVMTGTSSTIKWKTPNPCNVGGNLTNVGALIVTAYYQDGTNSRAMYAAVKPQCAAANIGTSFQAINPTNGVASYTLTLPAGSTPKLLRILALYNSVEINEVTGTNPNIVRIRSEAQSATNEFRAIEVERTVPAPPSIFDYALYSGGDLVKN